jgi:tight adherence protein G
MKRRGLLCEQRGSISILAAFSLLFVIVSAAMAVDVGQAAWQKRSLQKMTDVVALDSVRALGDRKDSISCVSVAQQLAQGSATRNSFDYANAALGNSLTIETGSADSATKAFTTSANCATANAVRITATSRSDNRFVPGSVGLTTQSVAMVDPQATYSLGSKLVALDSTTSPILNTVLKGMLGSSVNLSLVSYQGLAAGSTKFGPIWTSLGLGTASQILSTQVTVKNFLNAAASALNSQGDPASLTAATVLGTLAGQVDANAKFKFGDMMQFATGDPGSAATAKMDILEMVGMAASAANGTNLLNVSVPITIPGVTSTTMKMGIIEPPVIWSGRPGQTPGAHTAQVRIQFDSVLSTQLTVLLQHGTVHLPVYMEGAGANGDLTNVRCAIPSSSSDITVHTTTQAVTAKVGTATDSTMNDPTVAADVRAGQIVSISGLVNVTGTATASMPTSATDLVIPLLQTRSSGSSNLALSGQLLSSLALTVQVLGGGVNGTTVANNTLAIINPVLTTLDSTLLNPVKKAIGSLGIALGGADVTDMATSCGSRRLIG